MSIAQEDELEDELDREYKDQEDEFAGFDIRRDDEDDLTAPKEKSDDDFFYSDDKDNE